ncbi:hypothetical protein BpHYR1_022389 [Brachionus plicatilis]|uniref:Uncharacterized protein n=1 Tax=Brachionus plicatilis TaxID=10195 RepID=A0A3M7QMU6_BRAPC|nr:hypothetical protein BpHYR1_022389 [Brachionus plicatilis]
MEVNNHERAHRYGNDMVGSNRLKLSLVELVRLRSEKHEFFAVLGSYCRGQMFLLPFQLIFWI